MKCRLQLASDIAHYSLIIFIQQMAENKYQRIKNSFHE